MSTDTSDRDTEPQRPRPWNLDTTSWKQPLISFAVVAICGLVAWWTVGRTMYRGSQLASENRMAQQEMKQTLESSQTTTDRLSESLGTFRSSFEKETADLETFDERCRRMEQTIATTLEKKTAYLKTLDARCREMEQTIAATEEQFEKLGWQVRDFEAGEARSTAGAQRIKARADAAQRDLQSLRKAIVAWSEAKLLLENEAGRRIASRPEYVERFSLIADAKYASAEQATYWQDALDKLVTPVDRAITEDKGVFRTVDQHLAELAKVSGDVTNAANSLTRGILEAERLASESSNMAPGDGTLAQAIKAHKQAKEKAITDAILSARAAARKKAEGEAMRIAEAEEAKRYAVETLVQQEKIANERRQLEIELEDDRAEGERRVAQLARAKLLNEYERELPEIKSLLRPFITPALAQIDGTSFDRSAVPVPMSLARIQGSGALKDGVGGLTRLYNLGGSSHNGRTDRGGFPNYSRHGVRDSDHVLTTVKRAQELLIKYGDLLVEKELLRE